MKLAYYLLYFICVVVVLAVVSMPIWLSLIFNNGEVPLWLAIIYSK